MVSSSVLETFHNDSFLLMILCQNSTTEVSRKMPKSHLSCMSEPLRASDDIIIIIPTGTFSGNCHKTETSMVWACHTGLSILQGTLEDRRWSDWLRICWCGQMWSKSGHLYPHQNCSQWPPAEMTGEENFSPDMSLQTNTVEGLTWPEPFDNVYFSLTLTSTIISSKTCFPL